MILSSPKETQPSSCCCWLAGRNILIATSELWAWSEVSSQADTVPCLLVPTTRWPNVSCQQNCCSATLFYPSLGPEEAGEGWALSFILHTLLGMPLLFLMGRAAPATTMAMTPGQVWACQGSFQWEYSWTWGHWACGTKHQWENLNDTCSLMLSLLLATALFLSQNRGGLISHTGCMMLPKNLLSDMIFDLEHHSQFCLTY